MTETELQIECFLWHNRNFPNQRGLLFHVPNGGSRSKVEAKKLMIMGAWAGVSDFIYFAPNGKVLSIELKTEIGKQSPSQIEWQKKIETFNYNYYLVRNLDTFKAIILCNQTK